MGWIMSKNRLIALILSVFSVLMLFLPWIIPIGEMGKELRDGIKEAKQYMSIEDIENHYKLSKGWVQYLTRKMRIPRVQKGRYLYYDKKIVTEIFSKYQSSEGITEWYTAEDIEKKFNMTPQARGGFTCKHKIPKKRESGVIYYQYTH